MADLDRANIKLLGLDEPDFAPEAQVGVLPPEKSRQVGDSPTSNGKLAERNGHQQRGRPSAVAELLDQPLPSNHEAERGLLRALILDPGILDREIITADHFHLEHHCAIFVAAATLRENALPIDVAQVSRQLKADGKLDEIGGNGALAEILSAESTPAKAEEYLRAVMECHAKRQLHHAMTTGLQAIYRDQPCAEILATVRRKIDWAADDAGAPQRPAPQPARLMAAENPKLHDPVIDGILRTGEAANIIAPPKYGKSWLVYHIALSKVMGWPLFELFDCPAGRVLLIDNELHPPTLANRLRTVAEAMGIEAEDFGGALEVLSLRGRLMDLHGIAEALGEIEPGRYDLVILDAFYRAVPQGVSENDNAAIASLYNLIDATTQRLDCAWINVHHASKGSQGEKAITDVGAGAGSQSRAADAHLILRQHEESGVVVLEGVVRSFRPIAGPLPLRWEYPLWVPDLSVDPNQLRGKLTKGEEKKLDRDKEARDKILSALVAAPQTATHLRAVLGAGAERTNRLLDALEIDDAVQWREQHGLGRGGRQRLYWLAGDPEPPQEPAPQPKTKPRKRRKRGAK